MYTYCIQCQKNGCEDGDYKSCIYCDGKADIEKWQNELAIINIQISELIIKRNKLMEEIGNTLEWLEE